MHEYTGVGSAVAIRKKRMPTLLLLALSAALVASSPAMAQSAPTRAHGTASPELPARAPAQQSQQAPAAAPAAAAPAAATSAPAGALAPVQKTDIKSQAAYERLLNNSGISLQWLWSAQRGQLSAKDTNDVVRIDGTQANFEGTLKINGEIVSIDSDRFIFRGTILILDAPDKGRRCERTGDYEFRATGKRKYWRLQKMEQCNGLTDYVDIYY
ncbi:hypothetical protein LMG3431_02272 [Achromobacter pestifer]|uniref:Uncharacterized protein n=2 Tax=Achromobacter pestifer TaxID=1353889 RepID=A0A6S6YW79_9BURK|nr:hypothetical protein LMG3431_02272 [Achromobacter pestifer]